jgi:hypothetical protein
VLAINEYEEILRIMKNMAQVMELSPVRVPGHCRGGAAVAFSCAAITQ